MESAADGTRSWPGSASSFAGHQISQFLYCDRRVLPVKHRVAIWTDWTKVSDRIDSIFFPDSRNRSEVMYVNEASAEFTVHGFEGKAANNAGRSVVLNAGDSRSRIALVFRADDSSQRTLHQRGVS